MPKPKTAPRPRYIAGDRVISPDTAPAWRPLRITEAHVTPGGYCLIRIASLKGGWINAEAVLPVPKDATYDERRGRWMRSVGTVQSDVTPSRRDVLAQIGEVPD